MKCSKCGYQADSPVQAVFHLSDHKEYDHPGDPSTEILSRAREIGKRSLCDVDGCTKSVNDHVREALDEVRG